MGQHLVFVYGTLKRGYWNNRYLETSEFMGEAETLTKMVMVQLPQSFPHVVRDFTSRDRRFLAGELYRVDDRALASMDRLEGVPYHYQRRRVAVDVAGKVYAAWVYAVDKYPYGADLCPVDDQGRYYWSRREEDEEDAA